MKSAFVKREILPGDLEGEALDNLIRDGAMSMHHPTCTAKMGRDDLSVVDAQLRVYGVKKLRIADVSRFPSRKSYNDPTLGLHSHRPGRHKGARRCLWLHCAVGPAQAAGES